MLLALFLLTVVFGLILMWIGYSQQSFGAMYLAMFVFLILGLWLFQSGIDFENGVQYTYNGVGDVNGVINVYQNLSPSNNYLVSLFAYTFFFGAFGGVFLTTFIALRG